MANLAQEEADRYFTQAKAPSSHPEDRAYANDGSSEDEKEDISEPAFQKESLHDDTDDEDISHQMSTLTTSKATYQVPKYASYANTGPKGVIADAQSFTRAKQSAYRKTLASFTNGTNYATDKPLPPEPKKDGTPSTASDSDLDNSDEDEIMTQWRAARIAELAQQSQPQPQSQTLNQPSSTTQRRTSPSPRKYGHVAKVNAEGYLNAIEHSPAHTTVVVMLYDPASHPSQEVEDALDDLAEKWPHVRFVKLHYGIAEMEYLNAPAVLGYRAGDVFGTVNSARREGLEGVLVQQGFFDGEVRA